MSYTINNFQGVTIATVDDRTVNTELDLKLIGKDAPNYGEIQNENFVYLLENFSSPVEPPKPITGQTWYDTTAKTIRVYDGLSWKSIGGVQASAIQPIGSVNGDLWFDTIRKQLFVWNGTDFVLVGPQFAIGKGETVINSRTVTDSLNNTHAVLEGYVDGRIMFIASYDAFTLSNTEITNYNNRFTTIASGINLVGTNSDGVTTLNRFWGTASDSDKLGGHAASEFLLQNNLAFGDAGFTVGDTNNLQISIQSNIPTFSNLTGNTLSFTTLTGSVTNTPLKLIDNTIVPGNTNASTNIGSTTSKFATVYANSFNGTATKSDTLNVSGNYLTAATTPTASTITARDSSGNINANVFNGVATSARFADLAEKYLTDAEYPTGTVMVVGGEFEVTQSEPFKKAIGVISANPAFMMNCDLEGGQYVALKGRVPVKAIGKIKKGDTLVGHTSGCAMAVSYITPYIFAVALEDNDNEDVKLIEAIIL